MRVVSVDKVEINDRYQCFPTCKIYLLSSFLSLSKTLSMYLLRTETCLLS